jgi:beta-xylosidase
MKRITLIITVSLMSAIAVYAQPKTGSWGDQGNGTYINPILNADYSDPDVIRVNDKYYMVCSEFHFMGMPVLESEDMINWRIVSQIYSKLEGARYDSLRAYADGSWAPAIRHHGDRFYVYFCTPSGGLYMSSAEKADGQWSPLVEVKQIAGWEDPCPFWDEDGQAYLGHSRVGAGPIIIHRMSEDGTRLLDDGVTVYTGPVAEGTKILKRNGWYYMSIPEGGVGAGWQTVLRSKNIYGPYEKKVVLETGSTRINGPHQGAIVDTPDGEWWFYHFQESGAMGRVVHLQPVQWIDDFPVIGVDIDRNGIGEPVYVWKKPATGKSVQVHAPQSDDDFNATTLGLQWQFNHNSDNTAWSLTEKKGYLSLKAQKSKDFFSAKNTLTQKIMGTSGEVTVAVDISKLAEGQKAGIACFSSIYGLIGVQRKDGKNLVFFDADRRQTEKLSEKDLQSQPVNTKIVYLKIKLDFNANSNSCLWSTDNRNFKPLGTEFKAAFGHWKGARIGLFSYNGATDDGVAMFDWFKYDYDGPK